MCKAPTRLRRYISSDVTDVTVFSLPRDSPDQEVEGATILVRVDRDPAKRPEMKHNFVERADDRLIAVLEGCLGMKIGP